MSDTKRLSHILDFLLLTDRFKTIERKGYIADGSRRETDAEHTWHMGLFALLLHKELSFDVDIGRVLTLVLIHDLVEIHAGDTYAYDDAGCAGQAEREALAAEKLFAELPADLGAVFMNGGGSSRTGKLPKHGSPRRSTGFRGSPRTTTQEARRGAKTGSRVNAPFSERICRSPSILR